MSPSSISGFTFHANYQRGCKAKMTFGTCGEEKCHEYGQHYIITCSCGWRGTTSDVTEAHVWTMLHPDGPPFPEPPH